MELLRQNIYTMCKKTDFLKVKISLFKFENDSIELKNIELRKEKQKSYFSEPIVVSKDDMEKFDQKRDKKGRTY